jgi:hypothetical protein
MINTYSLFAVPVIHGKIIIQHNLHQKIIKYVEENYVAKDFVSCRNGFQQHENFNGKKELDNILNKYFFKTLHLKIIHAWLNVLSSNSYNRPHFHMGDNVSQSGVFYLSRDNNNINFSREGDTFEIKPSLYDYLVFPHSLIHYVLPAERNDKRICYAFNLTTIKEE